MTDASLLGCQTYGNAQGIDENVRTGHMRSTLLLLTQEATRMSQQSTIDRLYLSRLKMRGECPNRGQEIDLTSLDLRREKNVGTGHKRSTWLRLAQEATRSVKQVGNTIEGEVEKCRDQVQVVSHIM